VINSADEVPESTGLRPAFSWKAISPKNPDSVSIGEMAIFHPLPQHNFMVAGNSRQRGYFLQPQTAISRLSANSITSID